jgi:2-haloacid dehalogenase
MRPVVAEATGDPDLTPVWFGRLLRDAMVSALSGVFRPFDELAAHALAAVAASRHRHLPPADARRAVAGLEHLPPHPDVVPGLTRLREAGVVCGALSNSSGPLLGRQLRNAGLDHLLAPVVSVEEVGTYKPHPSVYRHVAAVLGLPVPGFRMVAAHDWDVTGAIRAGARAAFVARPGAVLGGAGERPDLVVPDLEALADVLVG